MEPRFREGELVFVDPDIAPTHGRFVVALVGSEGRPMLRRFSDEGERHYLVATNEKVPEPIIPVDALVEIVGVVFLKTELV